MTKYEIQQIIMYSEVGTDMKFSLPSAADVRKFSQHITRAERFGYVIVLRKLYNDVFYFEKLKEGDRAAYMKGMHNKGIVA